MFSIIFKLNTCTSEQGRGESPYGCVLFEKIIIINVETRNIIISGRKYVADYIVVDFVCA